MYTNAPTCYSTEVTQFAAVKPVPIITHDITGGAVTQTVNQNAAISPISYTASHSGTFTKTGDLPANVTGSADGSSSYTISGMPSETGAFGYSLTASAYGCTSAAVAGTITVTVANGFITSTGGPNTAYTTKTWIIGSQTWSDRITHAVCEKHSAFSTSDYNTAEYMDDGGRYYYSWTCAVNNRTTLCPSETGWRLPTLTDFETLLTSVLGLDQDALASWANAWSKGGVHYNQTVSVDLYGAYWSSSVDTRPNYGRYLVSQLAAHQISIYQKNYGLQVRCVK
jgi:uncharacterized protein (TIGR02145 family)